LTVYTFDRHKKMEGFNKIKAVQRSYIMSDVSANDLFINEITSYFISFNILNTLSSNPMLRITIPSEIKIKDLSICPKINTSSNVALCSFLSNNSQVI
jgi:hypothetical protein